VEGGVRLSTSILLVLPSFVWLLPPPHDQSSCKHYGTKKATKEEGFQAWVVSHVGWTEEHEAQGDHERPQTDKDFHSSIHYLLSNDCVHARGLPRRCATLGSALAMEPLLYLAREIYCHASLTNHRFSAPQHGPVRKVKALSDIGRMAWGTAFTVTVSSLPP
jgi:hypothetical protein